MEDAWISSVGWLVEVVMVAGSLLVPCQTALFWLISWLVSCFIIGNRELFFQTAALVGRPAHAKLVLDHGLNPNAVCQKMDDGKWESLPRETGPPVMIAAYMGHFEIVKLFAEKNETLWPVRDETFSKRNILHALMDMELITKENRPWVKEVKIDMRKWLQKPKQASISKELATVVNRKDR